MKVGTDAMLLGSWAPPPRPGAPRPDPEAPGPGHASSPPGPGARPPTRILDIGTGTGVLAIMMAQKTQQPPSQPSQQLRPLDNGGGGGGAAAAASGGGVRIVAIDVDAAAAAQAAENAARSPWGHRIRVLHASLQELVRAAEAAEAEATARATGTATGAAAEAAEVEARATGTATGEAAETVNAAVPCRSTATAVLAQAQAAGAVADPATEAGPRSSGKSSAVGTTDGDGVALPSAAISAEDVGPFDLIISNPPYFVDSSKPAQGRDSRAAARHADVSLPLAALAAACARLLAAAGSVCVVLPPPEASRFCAAAAECGLVLVGQGSGAGGKVELVRVFTAAEDPAERRHLMRLQRGAAAAAASPSPPSPPPRPIRFFTPEYLSLTADFHHPDFLTAAAAVAAAAAAHPCA
ncbi:hypothetical protein GPECTOR_4g677 [Gonium pectorale]|uniref:Methyltransferase small domain-containing protein n=1 Tax=Gonium pectorale TaxID=33097 RepID=A0A150GY32_GONPE|nr:hypothetical protein GPECTOR_4g677 [Gonium pectorale]|eukprot:KXZ54612.1 hypothetical protein GPECTOR_4g677 [Gonium pectorale]